jgi:hypothetical protein
LRSGQTHQNFPEGEDNEAWKVHWS